MGQDFGRSLKETADQKGVISLGYDPAPVDFPVPGISGYDDQLPDPSSDYDGAEVRDTIVEYFAETAEELEDRGVLPGAFKPNLGYFRMYDVKDGENWGTQALHQVLDIMENLAGVPIILDSKDADIGRSSAAYAESRLGEAMGPVDAVTVHPEMGTDSLDPFFQYAEERGQGVYVLTRTTNPGAEDFQDLMAYENGGDLNRALEILERVENRLGSGEVREEDDLRPNVLEDQVQMAIESIRSHNDSAQNMYEWTADRIVEWSREYDSSAVGSVAAGNNINELRKIASTFADAEADIPLLIPGVGTQGGKADEVVEALRDVGYDPRLARINSSSGIMYRAQKDGRPREEHAEASAAGLEDLNKQTDARAVG